MIHLAGDISYRQGTATTSLSASPLLVSFSSGSGTVFYSTFRVATNATAEQLSVLQFLLCEYVEGL